MTDQPMTATIPMDLLEAYVALQRAVEDGLEPGYSRGEVACCIPEMFELYAIAAACLAIDKLTKTEEGK